MSKKTKAASKERRQKEKRAKKSARKAQYEAWRDQGLNSKSKRVRLRNKRSGRDIRTTLKIRLPTPRFSFKDQNGRPHLLTTNQRRNTWSLKQMLRSVA